MNATGALLVLAMAALIRCNNSASSKKPPTITITGTSDLTTPDKSTLTTETSTAKVTTVTSTTMKTPLTVPLALTTITFTTTTTIDDVYDVGDDLCEQSPGSPWCGSDRSEVGFVTLLNIALLLVLTLIN